MEPPPYWVTPLLRASVPVQMTLSTGLTLVSVRPPGPRLSGPPPAHSLPAGLLGHRGPWRTPLCTLRRTDPPTVGCGPPRPSSTVGLRWPEALTPRHPSAALSPGGGCLPCVRAEPRAWHRLLPHRWMPPVPARWPGAKPRACVTAATASAAPARVDAACPRKVARQGRAAQGLQCLW